ncbi:proline-rich protein [Pimephales promelas]|nr:proline-rich protein [Pimephales promelas]
MYNFKKCVCLGFWLVWTLIIMLSCCCAYRHRRVKMRLQQEQRQREISLMAYQGASSSFITPAPLNLRLWTDCKLPDYEEVLAHPPTPPPPYSESVDPQNHQNPQDPPAPVPEQENSRRRHVTGDSGIEVCVCRLDQGPEEAEGCQGAAGCCSSAGKDPAEPQLEPERLV